MNNTKTNPHAHLAAEVRRVAETYQKRFREVLTAGQLERDLEAFDLVGAWLDDDELEFARDAVARQDTAVREWFPKELHR